jgi:oxygen-independent coproporphyrinogen-3 oxidase
MLVSAMPEADAVRFATADSFEQYVAGAPPQKTVVAPVAAFEENFFLGLRLNRGVDLQKIAESFGQRSLDNVRPAIAELLAAGLLQQHGDLIRLTPRGRLLSNEVFQRFLAPADVPTQF